MRYVVFCGGLAMLAACAAPEPERFFLLNEDTGARTELKQTEVLAGFNIDGTARAGWTEYEAVLGNILVSVNGVQEALPARLIADTKVSHHISEMFVVFSGSSVTAGVSKPFDGVRPDFDDFIMVAEFADSHSVCLANGDCAKLEGQPLRTGDIVLVPLP